MNTLGEAMQNKFKNSVNALTTKKEVRELAYRLGNVSPSNFKIIDPTINLSDTQSLVDLCEFRPALAKKVAELAEDIEAAQKLNDSLGLVQLWLR